MNSGSLQSVEALEASGNITGVRGGDYRPGGAISRGRMAVFLARTLVLQWAE